MTCALLQRPSWSTDGLSDASDRRTPGSASSFGRLLVFAAKGAVVVLMFGPAYSSDNAGDGPITRSAALRTSSAASATPAAPATATAQASIAPSDSSSSSTEALASGPVSAAPDLASVVPATAAPAALAARPSSPAQHARMTLSAPESTADEGAESDSDWDEASSQSDSTVTPEEQGGPPPSLDSLPPAPIVTQPEVSNESATLRGEPAHIACFLCSTNVNAKRFAQHLRVRHMNREAEARAGIEARELQHLVRFCGRCQEPYATGIALANHQRICRGSRRQRRQPPVPVLANPAQGSSSSSSSSSQPTPAAPAAPAPAGGPQVYFDTARAVVSTYKCGALRFVRRESLVLLRTLACRLLREIVDSTNKSPAIVALLGLPRLVLSVEREPRRRLDDFLRELTAAVPSSGAVFEALAFWTPAEDARREPPRPDQGQGLPVARIKRLVNSNNIGLAVQAVESAYFNQRPADPAAAREAIGRLFPNGSPEDLLPTGTDPSTALVLDQLTVGEALSSLPLQRAASFTGWTCDLVRQLAKDGPEFVGAVCSLFNAMLRGAAGPASLWSLDYIFPLEKRAGGYRPIVIGEVFPRILGRIVARQLSASAAEFLAPLQWGIGVSGGTETVAHTVSMFYHASNAPSADTGIQTVDFRNAFNTMRRSAIDAELQIRFPALLPYFRYCYGSPTVLRGPDGVTMARSETGVRQGDPLGPLLFCLGLDRVLRQVAASHPSVHIMALLDDVTIMGPSADILPCLETLSARALAVGLEVNAAKSLRLRVAADPPDAVRVAGTTVLGCAIGPDAWVLDQTRQRLEEYASILQPVVTLESQVAVPIVQCAVNARPVFTARTTLPVLAVEAFAAFDFKIDRALSILAGLNSLDLPLHSQLIRALPQRKGGLAIPRIADLAPYAYAASLTAAAVSLATRCQDIASHMSTRIQELSRGFDCAGMVTPAHYLVMTDAAGSRSVLPRAWAPPPAENTPDADGAAAPLECPSQKSLTANLVAAQETTLQVLMQADPCGRALVRSSSHRGSAWYVAAPRFPQLRLCHLVMQTTLAARLLAVPATVGVASRCQCGRNLLTVPERLAHGYNCARQQGLRTKRHNAVRDALADLLRNLFGTTRVAIEPQFGDRRPDISCILPHGARYIDVSIANPGAEHIALRAAEEDDAAANDRATEKRALYENVLAAHGVQPDAFVPFVLETTGRLGPDAKRFLDEVRTAAAHALPNRNTELTVNFYTDRIKKLLLDGTAAVMRAAWDSMVTLQVEPEMPAPALALDGTGASGDV